MKLELCLALILSSFVFANAQEATSAADTVDKIKLDLLDLQAREEGLKARLIELEEALKPENIARSLAGVGSTRPEELREARRRQLTIERDGTVVLKAGDRDFMPAGTYHSARVVSEEPVVYLVGEKLK